MVSSASNPALEDSDGAKTQRVLADPRNRRRGKVRAAMLLYGCVTFFECCESSRLINKKRMAIKSLLRKRFQDWFQRLEWIRTARFWGRQHRGQSQEYAFWLGIDQVMHWVNRKVSGQDSIWPLSWFLLSLPKDQVPVRHALSIGCGTGSVEREVIRLESALHVTGIDISKASLTMAGKFAQEAGYSDKITYRLSDAQTWLSNRDKTAVLDLILFHASLHHVKRLETVLGLCAEALRQGKPGLLYVDEYIGPSRHEWSQGDLGHAAALFQNVPLALRQTKTLRPPVAYKDPTEMVRSSEIERALESTFEVVEYKPYYGNVVMPLVSGIRPSGLADRRVQAVLTEAMQLEDYLIERGLLKPMHAVFVGRPL